MPTPRTLTARIVDSHLASAERGTDAELGLRVDQVLIEGAPRLRDSGDRVLPTTRESGDTSDCGSTCCPASGRSCGLGDC